MVYPSWATDFGKLLYDRLKELARYLPDMVRTNIKTMLLKFRCLDVSSREAVVSEML